MCPILIELVESVPREWGTYDHSYEGMCKQKMRGYKKTKDRAARKKEDIIYSSTFSYDPVHNFYIILTRIFSRLTNFVIHVGFVLTGGASLDASFVKIAFLSLITLN